MFKYFSSQENGARNVFQEGPFFSVEKSLHFLLARMIPNTCDDDEKFLCLHKRFKTISCHCDLLQNVKNFRSLERKCSKRGVREYLKWRSVF